MDDNINLTKAIQLAVIKELRPHLIEARSVLSDSIIYHDPENCIKKLQNALSLLAERVSNYIGESNLCYYCEDSVEHNEYACPQRNKDGS